MLIIIVSAGAGPYSIDALILRLMNWRGASHGVEVAPTIRNARSGPDLMRSPRHPRGPALCADRTAGAASDFSACAKTAPAFLPGPHAKIEPFSEVGGEDANP